MKLLGVEVEVASKSTIVTTILGGFLLWLLVEDALPEGLKRNSILSLANLSVISTIGIIAVLNLKPFQDAKHMFLLLVITGLSIGIFSIFIFVFGYGS